MFRQHKILCENKETVLYLFLYDQQIDLETMKIIFTQISSQKLESRILDYLERRTIKYQGPMYELFIVKPSFEIYI